MNKDVLMESSRRPRPPRIFATLLFVVGLILALGGGRLVTLGGSFYYLIAGGALIASAIGLWRAQLWGASLYGILTLGTVIWAIAEAGFDGWALAPRILPFLVLGLFLLRLRTRRALLGRKARPLRNSWISWAALASLIAICVGVALRTPYPSKPFPGTVAAQESSGDWQHWGGSAAGRRYAAFDQIDAANVSKLAVAWTYRTGVAGAFKATSLQIGDTLYVCLAGNIISALDSATGAERWRFDPQLKDSKVGFTTTCRGVTYYKASDAQSECSERILTATTDARASSVMGSVRPISQQPPYGEIAAVDLRTRSVLWRRPLGSANELGPLGLKFKLPIPMGVPYSGGTVVTKGGLVFMGGTMDRRFRALELKTGKLLWSDVLPNNAQATPMSYVSSQTGKQYVAIAVPAVDNPEDSHVAEPEAQQGASKTPPPANAGGWLIAYALPEADTR